MVGWGYGRREDGRMGVWEVMAAGSSCEGGKVVGWGRRQIQAGPGCPNSAEAQLCLCLSCLDFS